MPASGFARWQDWGIIPPAGDDGRWDEAVLGRVIKARDLAGEGLRLSRRVLLLDREGHASSTAVRRRAIKAVLDVLQQHAHKAAQVQWELRALGGPLPQLSKRARRLLTPPVPRPAWPFVIDVASDPSFERQYQWTMSFASSLPGMARERGAPSIAEVPYEERVALLMLLRLLEDPEVSKALASHGFDQSL